MPDEDPNPRAPSASELEPISIPLTLQQQIALDTANHCELHTPLLADAPPDWLRVAVEQARTLGRAGNTSAAKATVRAALAVDGHPRELARYRNKLTWVEGENAKKLGALAYAWRTLWVMEPRKPRPVPIDRAMERLERFGHMHYAIEAYGKPEWAVRLTKRYDLLPLVWRDA